MKPFRSIPSLCIVALLASTGPAGAQQPTTDDSQAYTVFLHARPVGQEAVSVSRGADGWILRGSNSLGPPLDVTTRRAEIQYTAEWHPTQMVIEGTSRGQDLTITTTFARGEAVSEISLGGQTSTKTDSVASDTLVLPNGFLGSYAALARRLVGQKAGATFQGYIAPQAEIALRVEGAFAERIETPKAAINATRYALTALNPAPVGEIQVSIWIDAVGNLLRMSVPAQGLEVARDDIASAAARTSAFSIPGDESVSIPASGFNLAASVSKPADAPRRLPAVILVPHSGAVDRDGAVAGIPVIGQLAADLVEAGFFVVRYDRRGTGQSGGRAETATINDYAEDVRGILQWLEKERRDVDKGRIALVGYGDGAWVALRTAERDKRVRALAMVAAVSSTGAEFILEQQRDLLARLQTPEAERDAKIAMQERINAAALKGGDWEGIPDRVREAADTPWFQSVLAFDPARSIRDLRQPLLVVHGELDTEVAPRHADRLAELGQARRRKVPTDIAKVPGVNHLLVPAESGRVEEYAALSNARVSQAVTSALATWLRRTLG